MRTLPNNTWWPDLLSNQGSVNGSSKPVVFQRSDSGESQPSHSKTKSREVSDDRLPFDALIRLVRIMRQ